MFKLMQRIRDEDEGFTLIELMVVVLIIAILIAIAIPTFLGARERANDRAAEANLRNAHTAAMTIYTDTQNFTNVVATEGGAMAVEAVEPSLVFSGDAVDEVGSVSIVAPDADSLGLATYSASSTCFFLVATSTAPVQSWSADPGEGGCQATTTVPAAE